MLLAFFVWIIYLAALCQLVHVCPILYPQGCCMFRSSTTLYYTQNVRLVTNHTPAWWHVKGWVSVTVDTFVSSIFHLDYDPYYNSIRASDSFNFSIPFLLWRVTFPLLFKKWICEVFLVKFGAVLIIMTVALVCYTRGPVDPFWTSGVLTLLQ